MTKPVITKNIIFDLGGVLLDIKPELTGVALEQMGVRNMEEVHSRLTDSGLYQRFDRGLCKEEEFRDEIRQACGIFFSDAQLDEAWNALLLDFPSNRVKLLHALAPHYRLFLLSNTNSIHYRSYTDRFLAVHGEPMSGLFEKLFLSYEMGIHKPDPLIYRQTLDEGNVKAEETLFVDDSFDNAAAAVKAGLTAIHLESGTEITDLFFNGFLLKDAVVMYP